ncbi:MAG TPA: trypsin-like peptidase domain-containing protein [Bacillota bacterium]|nr:trypsin-like peptidase domain-containing protein [Bacillota bacterium]
MKTAELLPGSSIKRRSLATGLLLATLMAAGCTTPKHNGDTTPQPSGKAGVSASPSPTEFAPPTPPEMPAPNLNRKPGSLVPCFAGDVALAAHVKPNLGLTVNPDGNGNLTGSNPPTADLQARVKQATVRIRYNLNNNTHEEGSGVIIDGQVVTAAHVVYGQKLANMQVIDSTGATHAVTNGCDVYQVNGKRATLDVKSTKAQPGVIDDVAILSVDGSLPGGLSLVNEQPQRGTSLVGAGTPTPQRTNGLTFNTSVQAANRDDSSQATIVLGGFGQSVNSGGRSGGPIVTDAGDVAGIIDTAGTMDQVLLGTGYNVFTNSEHLAYTHYTPAYLIEGVRNAYAAQLQG